MKKIMLALAVAVLAVAANAASFKWSGANIYGTDGAKFTGTAEIYAYLSSGTMADAVKVTDAFVVGGFLSLTLQAQQQVLHSIGMTLLLTLNIASSLLSMMMARCSTLLRQILL